MKVYVAVATALGGLTLFLWGTFSHVVLPWEGIVREFADPPAVAKTIRELTPSNGVYFAPQGVFVAVALRPDLADKSQMMGGHLLRQFLTELAVALTLALALLRTKVRGAVKTAGLFALFAVAAGLASDVPPWNWYGFSAAFTLANWADLIASWAIAGLVIGALRKKLLPAASPGWV